MSIEVNKNTGNITICESFNVTIQDPLNILPDEKILEIFSHFNIAMLVASCCVSKGWKRLANEPILWKSIIYKEVAFGNDKWAQCFGKDVVEDEDSKEEFSSFPFIDFIADCKKFKTLFPEKNGKDTLMLVRLPKTLNGGLTLKSLGELAKKYFSDKRWGYDFIWCDIVDTFGDISIDKSRWVLMTKDVLPESRNKDLAQHQKMVADLVEKSLMSYEVPEMLEAAACILSQYFIDSKTRLFSPKNLGSNALHENLGTYTRCKEKVGNYYNTAVGCFNPTGLNVTGFGFEGDYIGIAALRKF